MIHDAVNEGVDFLWRHQQINRGGEQCRKKSGDQHPAAAPIDLHIGGQRPDIPVLQRITRQRGKYPNAVDNGIEFILLVEIDPMCRIIDNHNAEK